MYLFYSLGTLFGPCFWSGVLPLSSLPSLLLPSLMDSMAADLPKIISQTAAFSWEENPPHLEPASKEQTAIYTHWGH